VADPLFEPAKMLEVLARHQVEYVLIGGLAATLHGSPAVTNDADICPARTPENLTRLGEALREIEARVRTDTEPRGLPFACDAEFLSRMRVVNLVTVFGTFDISFEPAGFDGYGELVAHAVDVAVGSVTVKVASLADVIRSKETANRPKDRATLPILYALQDEIAKREES
jgi:hypothetical protein